MFSRLFGSKKNEQVTNDADGRHDSIDLSFLAADLHSHFIPGIDDGAQTVDDSIAMIRQMMAMGYKKIVTTPHINFDHYPNTNEKIAAGLEVLKAALKENGIEIPVKAAAEYFVDDYFLKLLDENIPLLPVTKKQVLIEFSFMAPPVGMHEILFQMQIAGYTPIIAHPERYMYYHEKRSAYEDLKDRGCFLQLNLLSLTGYYGNDIKHIAEYIFDKGLYDYCGTDMHHVKHAEAIQKLKQSKYYQKLQKYPFLNSRIE